MRKFNAILTLLAIGLTCGHMIHFSLTMLGLIPFSTDVPPISYVFIAVVSLHIIVSIGLFFFSDAEAGKKYPKNNAQTIEQRVSAMLIGYLVHPHSQFTVIVPTGMVEFIPGMLLLIAVVAHIQSSVERALITLGINFKVLRIVIRAIILLLFVASVAGFIKDSFFRFDTWF